MTTRKIEWPTLMLLTLTYGVWGCGTFLWDTAPVLAVAMTALAIAQHASLQHEALHGHPFRSAWLNEVLVFPALNLVIPYHRFRDTHLQHHYDPNLTDPYDDPESNYHDPAVWARLGAVRRGLCRANNTLAGRMVLGPILGTVSFVAADLGAFWRGDPAVVVAWMLHLVGVAMVVAWVLWAGMPVWAYLLAVWLALSVLKIRSFLEHRAHEASRARTVIVEDRGPLSILFLNNNLHVVHHMHPLVPWYELPALYAARKAHYLRRNEGYVYANYAQIFCKHFLRAKDPVAHPIWPLGRAETADEG